MDVANVSVQMTQTAQNILPENPQQANEQVSQNFLAVLLSNLFTTDEEGSAADILSILKAARDGEKNGTDMALQMMMEMMAGNAIGQSMMQNLQVIDPETLAEFGFGTVKVLENFAADQEGQQEVLQELLAAMEPEEGQEISSDRILENIKATVEQGTGEEAAEEVIPMTVEHHTSRIFFDQGTSDFRSAVTQAKREMGLLNDTRGQKREEIDVDRLQGEADTQRVYTPVNTTVEAEQLPDAPVTPAQIADQVKEGIISQLDSGKDEFVIKLQPEGLGEITVKLVQEDGKIALSIAASNSQVARLLSSEIEQLRESLRPYNTVVQEVVDQQAYASNQDFGQNFSNSQYRQQQFENQHHSRMSFQEFINGDTAAVEEISAGERRVISTGLNSYIV